MKNTFKHSSPCYNELFRGGKKILKRHSKDTIQKDILEKVEGGWNGHDLKKKDTPRYNVKNASRRRKDLF